MESDFRIRESSWLAEVIDNVAVVNLSGEEEDAEHYVSLLTHELLHLAIEKAGVPIERQEDWVIDQVLVEISLWFDM